MTAADLQRLLACLPHGTELAFRIVLTSAPVPSEEVILTQLPPIPQAAEAMMTQLPPVSAVDPIRAPDPSTVAAEMQRAQPTARLSIGEWCAAMENAVSARELKRAISAGVLTASPRGFGRGHGAMVIAPNAMHSYLETRARMMEEPLPKEAWFFDVVRGTRTRVA
ncbi:MAG: hypothetical protein ACYC1W_02830 [Gemmatimonadaceae bacterium]|jgi:hypothetical protein